MKIAYVTATMPFGNGESFLIAEVTELLKKGIDVIIVPRSPENSSQVMAPELARLAFPAPLLSFPVLWGAMLEALSKPLATIKAARFLLRCRSPKVFFHNVAVFPKALWFSRLAACQKVDHIHAHWCSTTASLALFASTVSGIPWSVTAHRGDIVANNLLQVKFENARFVRFISHSGRNLAKSVGADLGKTTAVIVHMGAILPEVFKVTATLSSTPTLLCPATFFPVKGHKYLLGAIAILRDRGVQCRLQLAGEGFLYDELQKQVASLRLEPIVQFMGHLPHSDVMSLYRENKVDLVILPSIDLGNGLHEGIPVSLIEAMGYGIPVVSTRTGGIPELLSDGAGVLVPPENALALADAIQHILEDNTERLRLIEAGRSRVMKHFAVESVVAELLDNFSRY
ncbi:glycosyltransferase [Geomonas oryzisoli]|uniref:Glycosyltransferase n=1 Tax=Geomonas oryzisoli TaxID=2847992 RepID=A0ABX8J139_9BACT|nr:glycosyltransferase [Geomonas oryzisoli]QWV91958.1 glycosyltransferase [Geomonas oryzisoli]